MKIFFFAFSLVLAAKTCSPEEAASFSIIYDSWTERIEIEEGRLSYFVTRYEYEKPYMATPSSSQVDTVALARPLSPRQLHELASTVRSSGFFSLDDAYGAPEGHRYYPYAITVIMPEKEKTVSFRSNPEFEEAPPAFQVVEKKLREVAGRK